MPDYIATSLKLSRWLKEQGIVVEVDEHALVVRTTEFDEYIVQRKAESGASIRAIYYGPGGSDNTMKALRAWCEKNGCYLALEDTQDGKAKWLLISEDTVDVGGDHLEPPQLEPELILEGEGNSDGEALHDLLYNLMEAK